MNWFARQVARVWRPEAKSSLSVPDADLFSLFLNITNDSALRVPAVACAVRAIAEVLATLPITINEVQADGSKTPLPPDDPIQQLVSGDWNPWTSSFDGLHGITRDALTNDLGGLAWVNRVDGKPVELVHYRTGTWSVMYDVATGEPSYKLGDVQVDPADVVHIRSPLQKCPTSLACEAIKLACTLEAHAVRLFQNGAKPSGMLTIKGATNPDTVSKIREAWNNTHGSGKSGGTAVVGGDVTFSQLTFSSVDNEFQSMREFQILEIARAFRVAPHLLFELGRATWSNTEQLGQEFIAYTLEPWILQWQFALRRALFSPEDRSRYEICFETADLTKADLGARATSYANLIASRVMSPNEARAKEGLPPYPAGSEFLNPNITTSAPIKAPNQNADGTT